jgi:hypothetical protein
MALKRCPECNGLGGHLAHCSGIDRSVEPSAVPLQPVSRFRLVGSFLFQTLGCLSLAFPPPPFTGMASIWFGLSILCSHTPKSQVSWKRRDRLGLLLCIIVIVGLALVGTVYLHGATARLIVASPLWLLFLSLFVRRWHDRRPITPNVTRPNVA